jgi:hypothetical protein
MAASAKRNHEVAAGAFENTCTGDWGFSMNAGKVRRQQTSHQSG